MFVSVYAPQSIRDKHNLWLKLLLMTKKWNKMVLMGDFNKACKAVDRFGSILNQKHADYFNDFIMDVELIDVDMEGYSFTWTNRPTSK